MTLRELLRAIGRDSPGRWLRRVLVAAAVTAAAVNFSLFSPAYRFSHAEGYRQATFDLWINGPMDGQTVTEIAEDPAVASAARVVDITPLYLELGQARAVPSNGRFFDDAAATVLLYADQLRQSGGRASEITENDLLLDRRTAETLQADIGDHVQAVFLREDGSRYRVELVVFGVYATTGQLSDSIGGLASPEILAVLASGVPRYSSVFVKADDPPAVRAAIEQRFAGELQVFTRDDLLRQAIAQVQELVDPAREAAFLGLAAALLAIFLVRDLRATHELRAKSIAVLLALGVPSRRIARAILAEQLVLIAVAMALGLAAGVVLFLVSFHLPIPIGDLGLLIVGLGLVAVASSTATVWFVTRRVDQTPIIRLLFEGT